MRIGRAMPKVAPAGRVLDGTGSVRSALRLASLLLFMLSGVLQSAQAQPRMDWQPLLPTVAVELPSCEAADALIIRHPRQLRWLHSQRYRVFCFAPGDYRSAGAQRLTAISGSDGRPRVLRLLGDELASPSAFAQAPAAELALLPPLYFRDSQHWVLSQLAFVNIDTRAGTFPLRFFNSNHVLMDSLRVQGNRHGIEFHHGSHHITLQHSLIGDMDMDKRRGNDAVCVAFEGRRTDRGLDAEAPVIRDIHVLANEIYNCNDGVQLIWNKGHQYKPDFSGTLIAGNDIYIDQNRLSNCKGKLDPAGDCACTENAIDIKAGAERASDPVVIRHNRFYGWRKTDSSCNPDADSWGTAISVHYEAAKHLLIEKNLFWNVVSGVSLTHEASDVAVVDNLFYNVPKAGPGNGIAIVSYDGVDGVEIARNRVVEANNWLSLKSKNTSLSCNIISQSGPAVGAFDGAGSAQRNSYYQHGERRFKARDDVQLPHRLAAEDVDMCFTLRPLSGARELCLPRAASSPKSPHACGSGYWTVN